MPKKQKNEALKTDSHYIKAKSLKISVTAQDVVNHIDFLRQIDAHGQEKYYDETFCLNAIRRYEEYWLPLILSISENIEDDLLYAPPKGNYIQYSFQ